MAFVGPYFSTKTEIGKEDIFIDVNNKNRMGIKYHLEVNLMSTDEDKVKYIIPFIQFIIDVRESMCLPFINEIECTTHEEDK